MPAKKNNNQGWLAINATPILDLFMLATFVFAMNADVADKKYERVYGDRLVSATNVIQRISSQLDDLQGINRTQESKIAGLQTSVSLYSDMLEKAHSDKQRMDEENQSLQKQIRNAESSVARLEVLVADATNNVEQLEINNRDLNGQLWEKEKQVDELEERTSKLNSDLADRQEMLEESKKTIENLQKRIEGYAEREKEYAKLDRFRDEPSLGNGKTNVFVRVCVTDDRLFWWNNHEWTSCALKDNLEEFLKTKSFPDQVCVCVEFVGFYNCGDREKDYIGQLRDKFGNVYVGLRNGCHLVHMRNGGSSFVDLDEVPYSDLASQLGRLAKEDQEDDCSIKYFLVRPSPSDDIDGKVHDWLKQAYGREIAVEVIKDQSNHGR